LNNPPHSGENAQEIYFFTFKNQLVMRIEKCKNYVKQRMFIGNALTREAGLSLLSMDGLT